MKNPVWKACFVSFVVVPLMLSACAVKYPVVGSFNNYNEVFKGTVDTNLLTGGGYITVEGQVTKIRCSGRATVSYIPPISYIVPTCNGQRGRAFLTCDDGRKIDADWEATSCTTGFGSGADQKGNVFRFAFGMSENEAKSYIQSEMKASENLPDLPPVYRPKETRKEKGFSTGTGFFISDNGYLLTNYHVVQDSNQITVFTQDGVQVDARLIVVDPANDLAVLKVECLSKHLELAERCKVEKGDEVFTLGYPLILIQGQEQKASFGRINSLSGIKGDIRFLQIDTPIQPGNSGGPLIDSKGRVVGVVTATLDEFVTLVQSGALPQNVNYAVKSDYITPIARDYCGKKSTKQAHSKTVSELIKEAESSVVLVVAK
jgi:S1-C subfamily serine protease